MAKNGLKGYIPAIRYGWQLGLDELWNGGATIGQVLTWNGTVWAPTSVGGGLPSLASEKIWIGNGSNVATAAPLIGDATFDLVGSNVVATVTGLQGITLNTSMDNPTKNVLMQYSGSSVTGWVPTSLKSGTASIGEVTLSGNGTNSEITTDVLTVAPGGTYTLTVTDSQLTAASNYIWSVVQDGFSGAGNMQVTQITKSNGSVVFTMTNIDPSNSTNGQFILSYFAI